MSKCTIADTRVKLRPSRQLLELLYTHREEILEIPEHINKALKAAGFEVNFKVEISADKLSTNLPKIDTALLQNLCSNKNEVLELPNPTPVPEVFENNEEKEGHKKFAPLYLTDLIWLNKILTELRAAQKTELFLYNLLENCEMILPENAVLERNPELEQRCQRLRDEQDNFEYMKMTKNVDSALKNYPEDTIAFQLKSLNSQMIAVFQFVVSVITGFVFGFIGIPLLSGNMDFGARLILGIFCAIIVAIAEIYFLAKKLNEYDDTVGTMKKQANAISSKKGKPKPHVD